ncbi:hypothetical protein [Chryseobacterium oncorhynchi]|uniref:Branched-chain amino acid:cation transporter, LIVCS family n=1 Tax=Chryseobacterium oncorhynchi TaxID=741074 RepID=A0A316WFD2_9FLAO|nr:hypothetical protein [Chryseobacterium oncorhynchi]PWN60107.1 hypothetical protein C1638_020150 [Chryseobacterium oncorhynchi]
MTEQNILNLGKTIFGLFFLAGNICLFGYIITKDFDFADSGFILLVYGAIFNLFILSGLLIYGEIDKVKRKVCYQSAGFLLINIPVSILYAIIGLNII